MAQLLSAIASVLLFAIGVMLTYEVVARYFFNAPTIWAEELSRLAMIWAVFLGSAALLRSGEHIRVTVLTDKLSAKGQAVMDVFALVFVAVISGFVAWHGAPIAWDSYVRGRTVGSMLDLPSWVSQASVPLGFGLIAIQAVALILARPSQPPKAAHPEHIEL
ncbi:TRAP transporter small permease [Acuticoccus sediminis]|uniref:TRAP transporter small permease n=1 Tax=Acuticoccus sediminis TaxID=2184697 RepID=UPI001CFECCFC|nr:TRAP transporter small permease [Acuticoccus sediminis]